MSIFKKIKGKRLLIKTFKNIINDLEDENQNLKAKIRIQEHNNLILLENARKHREEIKNLENNLEFVTNNLSAQKRKKLGL